MAILTTDFVTSVKRKITIPSNQALIDDEDILALADDAIQETMVPLLIGAQQNYFVYFKEINLVDGQESYDIPERSVGRGLRELKLSYDGTNTGISDLTMIELENRYAFSESGTPVGYYFQGDKIILVPTPNSAQLKLLYWYEIPPSKLILPSSAAKVTSISPGVTTTDVVVDLLPTAMVTGSVVDVIQGKSGNTLLNIDSVITNVSGTTLTFNNTDLSTSLVAGDYIAFAGYSPVIQIPNEGQPLLEAQTAIAVLEAVGDFDGAQKLDQKTKGLMDAFKKLIEPRNQGSPRKIVQRNGLLRNRGRGPFFNRLYF